MEGKGYRVGEDEADAILFFFFFNISQLFVFSRFNCLCRRIEIRRRRISMEHGTNFCYSIFCNNEVCYFALIEYNRY